MTTKATSFSRIAQSESGKWRRQQEHFPGHAPQEVELWEGHCFQRPAKTPKEDLDSDIDAISQVDFTKYVREVISEVAIEWERRRKQQQTKIAYDILSRLVGETTRLFGENVRIYESRDPEFPDDANIVLRVETPMSSTEALRAEREWAKAVREIAPKAGLFNLVIYRK